MRVRLENMIVLEGDVKEDYINWISFLTEDKEDKICQVIDLYESNGAWGSTVMSYRETVRAEGRGEVDDQEICNVYVSKDVVRMGELLSEKCLENISQSRIKDMLKVIKQSDSSIECLLGEINRRPHMRLGRLISNLRV